MNYTKRALTSSFRNICKTFIFLMLVILISSVISAMIFVNQAAQDTEQNLLNNLPPKTTIQVDREEFWSIANQSGEMPAVALTPTQIRRIAELPYVQEYDFFSTATLYSTNLTPFTNVGQIQAELSNGLEHRWVIHGVQNPNIYDMRAGHIELVYGRIFTTDEVDNLSMVALISENVAIQNNLSIGSTVSLRNVVRYWYATNEVDDLEIFAEESYNVMIVGIFRPLLTEHTVDLLDNLENRIYVPNTFVEAANHFRLLHQAKTTETMVFDENKTTNFTNIFILNSANDLPAFREAALNNLPRQFMVYDAGNPFKDISSSMDFMIEIASFILYLTVLVGIIALSLLIIIFLYDRKGEIGIYLSLGEKKSRVLRQFALEFITVAVLGIAVALLIGQYVSGLLTNSMLINNTTTYQMMNIFDGIAVDPLLKKSFQANISIDELMRGHTINLNWSTVLTFFTVGVGTTALSTIAPLVYILRLDPKKIMM